ncbi:uncharacterized protein LOC111284374 [Durio zibethinus]|uniref:Uncharacterized protein LOC111284374 n=1 Tax=Durio zibethinus TaxID=66656 RepID=A0A6P5XLJ8_DURZI|nr:uncharacterized protein LOC111284374 [Durio zibethinus]
MGEEITSNIHLHDDQVEEPEEALSLCDLPLDLTDTINGNPENDHLEKILSAQSRRSSSTAAPEFFEFLNDISSDMCAADDIIFCGKLFPSREQPISFQTWEEKRKSNVLRKRSESLSELCSSSITRSNSTKNTTLLRSSRSLDYQKLHRYDMERNPSVRRVERHDQVSPKKLVKPRWYVFMFGMVKFPPEMELKDIKSRQSHRSPSIMFPTVEDGGKKLAGNRSSNKCSSWSLLKALSCRDHTSVDVTASFWMPHA